MSACEVGEQHFIGVLLLLHCKDDASNAVASSLLDTFVEPEQRSTLGAGTDHPPKVTHEDCRHISSGGSYLS